jgi:flagellar motor switch/type III secretory pathway protein FliN
MQIVAPILAAIANGFIEAWHPEMLRLCTAPAGSTLNHGDLFDFAAQLGGGELRIGYSPSFSCAIQPKARPAPTAAFAATPVRVRAVLARPLVSIRTFAALALGHVLPLGELGGVTLIAGDREVGVGDLVGLGCFRGVRVSNPGDGRA